MGSTKNFWIFSDAFCFFGFFTQNLYNLVPIVFLIQLKIGLLKPERLTCFGILCLYGNAFIYFFLSIFHKGKDEDLDPLNFCNLAGAYLGFIYLILYFYHMYFKTNKLYALLFTIILALVSGIIFIILALTVNEDDDNTYLHIFNWIGVIFNVLENLPLGFNIIYLIKNNISEKFTLIGATIGIINEITWLSWAIYSVKVNEGKLYHSITANILGICIHITQFFLFFYNPKDEEDEEKNEQLNSSATLGDDSNIENEKINKSNNNKEEEKNEPEYMKEFL
jgi:hypothetical protein